MLASQLFDDWIDPIETGVRARVRDWIEALIHSELDTALQRPRYGRSTGGETEPAVAPVRGYRNGSRTRTLTGTFGKTDITAPRARLQGADGATTEWKSKALRAYQRRTKAADALIASAYLSGTNTRRVRRALAALFDGAVGKDTVSRVWRKVQTDWDAWNARPLKDEPIVRLILDGTVVRVRLDKKATARRPIGKFQAIQQYLAVMAGQVAGALGAADIAAEAIAEDVRVLPIAAAKVRTGEAASISAAIAHQVHGAIGFTHEHSLHFFTKRLWSWRDEFGSEAEWSGLLVGKPSPRVEAAFGR